MKVMRLHAINDFRLEEIETPVPKGDEILVRIGACGICGSDIPRVYQLGTRVYPVVIGHEFSGTVCAVGNPKDEALIGKKAAIFPLIPCRECEPCEIGQFCQCENYDYLGSRSNGGFAEYCLLPSRWHLVLAQDENIDLEALSMCEPACVAQHALRRGNSQIILTDIDEAKQKFAQERGFTVINSRKENLKERIDVITNGRGVDVVIEGTGCSAGINDAIQIVRVGGTIVWLGNPHADTTIQLNVHSLLLRKELEMHGVWNSFYAQTPINEWEYTVQMIEEGKLEVSDLITHRAGLKDLKQLFDDIHNHSVTICKALYSAALDV